MFLTRHSNAIFLGGCWFCTIFQLPQRYQVVHRTSPLGAGIRSIPFIASAPISSAVSAALTKKGVPPVYLVIGASALEVIGFSLLGTISPSTAITARQYGYEIIAGFGCGSNISLLVLLVPFSVQPKDTCKYFQVTVRVIRLTLNFCSRCYGFCDAIPHDGRSGDSCHRQHCAQCVLEVQFEGHLEARTDQCASCVLTYSKQIGSCNAACRRPKASGGI